MSLAWDIDENRVGFVNFVVRDKLFEVEASTPTPEVCRVVQVYLGFIGAGKNELQRTQRMRTLAFDLHSRSQASGAPPRKISQLLSSRPPSVDSTPNIDTLGAVTGGSFKLKRI